MFYLDGSPVLDPIVDIGRSGIVVDRDGDAVKLPYIYSITPDMEAQTEDLQKCFDYEKEVYRRLGDYPGIIHILDLDGPGITMELMSNGTLRAYLDKQKEVPNCTKLAWFLDMARTLVYIHDHRVVVADISTTNLLLAVDLSIRFSDFGEASIFPLDTDMTIAEDGGFSVFTDIGQIGAVIYEVVTGLHCKFDLFEDASCSSTAQWPSRGNLPSTEDLWLGDIIEACWTKSIRNASDLLARLSLLTVG